MRRSVSPKSARSPGRDQNDALRKALAAKQKAMADKDKAVAACQVQCDSLKCELQEKEKLLQKKANELSRKSDEVVRLRKSLAVANEKAVATAQTTHGESDSRHAEEVRRKNVEIAELRKQKREADVARRRLELKVQQLEGVDRIAAATQTTMSWDDEVLSMKRNAVALGNAVAEKEALIAKLREELLEAQRDASERKEEIAFIRTSSKQEIEQLRSNLGVVQEQHKQYLQRVEGEVAEASSRRTDFEKELSEARERIKSLEEVVEQCRKGSALTEAVLLEKSSEKASQDALLASAINQLDRQATAIAVDKQLAQAREAELHKKEAEVRDLEVLLAEERESHLNELAALRRECDMAIAQAVREAVEEVRVSEMAVVEGELREARSRERALQDRLRVLTQATRDFEVQRCTSPLALNRVTATPAPHQSPHRWPPPLTSPPKGTHTHTPEKY